MTPEESLFFFRAFCLFRALCCGPRGGAAATARRGAAHCNNPQNSAKESRIQTPCLPACIYPRVLSVCRGVTVPVGFSDVARFADFAGYRARRRYAAGSRIRPAARASRHFRKGQSHQHLFGVFPTRRRVPSVVARRSIAALSRDRALFIARQQKQPP